MNVNVVETLEVVVRVSLLVIVVFAVAAGLLSVITDSYHPCKLRKVEIFLDGIGLRESLGTLMNLLLLMLLRSHLPPSLLLTIRVTRKVLQKIRNVVTGKVKGIGRRNGANAMQEKGSLHCL